MAKKHMEEGLEEFDFFEIDQFRLNEEWIAQPRLYFVYAVKLADARAEHEQAKAKLDLREAELDGEIRADPEAYGIDKLSNPVVAKAIQTQKDYLDLREAMFKKKKRVEILTAAVNALDHRKKALENLVSLTLANYYAEPRVKEEGARKAMDKVEKEAVYDRLKKKRSK